jgi:hypothetical protein
VEHTCTDGHVSACEDLPAPAPNSPNGRICHCDIGYQHYQEDGGCVNIDVCTDTNYYFDNCGANTICVDSLGGSLDEDGKTCECISNSYVAEDEYNCRSNVHLTFLFILMPSFSIFLFRFLSSIVNYFRLFSPTMTQIFSQNYLSFFVIILSQIYSL